MSAAYLQLYLPRFPVFLFSSEDARQCKPFNSKHFLFQCQQSSSLYNIHSESIKWTKKPLEKFRAKEGWEDL